MFNNLKWNKENVWVGDVVFKFYHAQRCPHCNYAGKGYNDLKDEGPWDFECYNCHKEWSIAMDDKARLSRRRLLNKLHHIDRSINIAKSLNRRFIKR